VGTLPEFDKAAITSFFKGLFITKVKDSISSYFINKDVSILEINAYLDELSLHLKGRIVPTLDEYGISLLNFYVKDISVPEDDPAVIKLKNALAKKAEMDIIGYSYVQERSFNALEGAAANPGSVQSGIMGAGVGMGMGIGLGGAIGTQAGQLAQNMNINEMKKCPGCKTDIQAAARFCPACGYDTQKAKTLYAMSAGIMSLKINLCPPLCENVLWWRRR
jgi:membrane protease subunit (stomatin/prohibitin family)